MADHLDAVETNFERVTSLSSLGDVAVENAEDVLRTEDAAAGTTFALVEEGGTRQRVRSLETAGGAIRRSEHESTASYVTVHHAPEDVPTRLWRLRGGFERVGTPRTTLGSLGQRHSERCRQASDPPRHGSRRHPSPADIGWTLEL